MDLRDDNYCFACGKDNPIGLKLEFIFDGESVLSNWTPRREHQGWNDVIHGGILATLMDEAMARLLIESGHPAVTKSMETRFLRPAKVGEALEISAKIEKIEETQILASSILKNASGKAVASSRGKFVKMNFQA